MPNSAVKKKKKERLVKVSRGGSTKNISKRRCRANNSPFYQSYDLIVYSNLKSHRSAKVMNGLWFKLEALRMGRNLNSLHHVVEQRFGYKS